MRILLGLFVISTLAGAGCMPLPYRHPKDLQNEKKPEAVKPLSKPVPKPAPEPVELDAINLNNAREMSEKLERELDYAQQNRLSWKKAKPSQPEKDEQ